MSERDDERLSAYLDGELDPEEAARLRAELDASPALRALLETLRGVDAGLRALPARAVPAPLRAALDRRLAERDPGAGAAQPETPGAGGPASEGTGRRPAATRPAPARAGRGRRTRPLVLVATAVAAGLLVVLWLRGAPDSADAPPLARAPETAPLARAPEPSSDAAPPDAGTSSPTSDRVAEPTLPAALAALEEELEAPDDLAVIEMLDWLEELGEIEPEGRG